MNWSDLPNLPLCRVYEYLSISECLAAATCCKNWRNAFMIHRTKRDHLSLKVDSENVEKNVFLSEIFSRNVTNLQVTLASSIDEYTRFTTTVLWRFCESKHLSFITFRPTSEYLTFENTHNKEFMQRTLIPFFLEFCELPTLRGINIHGCGELTSHASVLLQTIKQREYFHTLGLAGVRPSFSINPQITPQLIAGFTSLRYLSLDYGCLDGMMLQVITERIPFLQKLVLNVTSIPAGGFCNLHDAWRRINPEKDSDLAVTINCISLPPDSLSYVNEKILSPHLPLAVLRVMFCKSMNMDILRKMTLYTSLKELVWVDSVITNSLKNIGGRRRSSRRASRQQTPNPLVMMCWRCPVLENISIHGYWHSAHDLLGMAKLRGQTLRGLSVSALLSPALLVRPRTPFTPARLTKEDFVEHGSYLTGMFVEKMKSALTFDWSPPVWEDLHPSIVCDTEESPQLAQDYIIGAISSDIPSM